MTDTHHDRSSPRRTDQDGDRRAVLNFGTAAVIAMSLCISLASYGALPSQLRIHWTLGAGPYVGPEFAPTVLVMVTFPVLVAALAVYGRAVILRVRAGTRHGPTRPCAVAALFAMLGSLVGMQLLLVVANL